MEGWAAFESPPKLANAHSETILPQVWSPSPTELQNFVSTSNNPLQTNPVKHEMRCMILHVCQMSSFLCLRCHWNVRISWNQCGIWICRHMLVIRDFYDAVFFFLVCMCSVSFPSAVSCVVSEWTEWSGCAEPCRATVRRRSRTILQEPLNAGQPCPHLEEHAGCAEYWSQQGHCHNSLGEFLLVCKIK